MIALAVLAAAAAPARAGWATERASSAAARHPSPAAATGAALSAGVQSVDLLSSELSAYAGALGPYRDGIWRSKNPICWSCDNGGPATAAATVYMLTGQSQPQLLREAEGTIDAAIERQGRDGIFEPTQGDIQPADSGTVFFAVELGNTYLELSPLLTPARRGRWRLALIRSADYLIRNGNLSWYTNGNINLDIVELMYLAWRATGDPSFLAAYEQAWSFTLNPPQTRWPGCGLILLKWPRRPDGSDGAGYLAETGAGGTGFDAEYSSLQLDTATRLYLLSGDPRALRLANLLVNTLVPRVSSSWLLDTSGGTRHTEPDRWVPLISSAFAVLGLDGGRTDLIRFIMPQLRAIEAAYAQPWNDYNEVFRRALGNDISVIALATNLARPVGWATEARVSADRQRHA